MSDIHPDLIATIDDVRQSGICVAGARRWFEQHGFDFKDFIVNGIAAASLAATGDASALRVVQTAQERAGG